MRLFAPGFFGNNTDVQWSFLTPHEEVGYVGLLPLILALAAPLLSHSVKIRRAVWFAWCLLPIAVMMAMGRKLPLYGWVFEVFPPLRQTRVPARWMEIFYYGAALLTGVGFDALIRRRIAGARVERWIGIYFKVLCGVFVLLLAAIALTPPSSSFWIHLAQTALRDSSNFLDDATELWRTAMVESLITVAFAGSLAFLWQRWYSAQETKQIHRLRMMLLILVVLDLTGYFWRSAKVAPQSTMRSHATLPTSLTSRYNAQERWDTKLSYALMNHCAARGIDIFTGYDALGTKRYFQFVEGLEGHSLWGALYEPERRTPLLRVAGVTHSITSPKKTVPKGSKEFPDYKPQLVAADGEFKLWKWEGAWPRAYLTRNVQSAPEKKQLKLLETLANNEKTGNHPPVVVASNEFSRVQNLPFAVNEGVQHWQQSFDRVTFKTRAKAPSILVFADTNFPGWKAFVNKQETPIEQANFLFRAIELPAGESTVEMIYEPQTYKLGLFLTLFGLGALGFLGTSFIAKNSRAKRRRQSATPS